MENVNGSINNIGEIRDLLGRFQTVKFGYSRRDIVSAKTTSREFESFLLNCFDVWDAKTKTLYKKTIGLHVSDVSPGQVSPIIIEIVYELRALIEVLSELKKAIGPVTFENVQEDLTKKVLNTIDLYDTLLQIIVGEFPFDQNFIEKTLPNIKLQAMLGKLGNGGVKATINQAAAKPLPGAKEYSYKKSGVITRTLLDTGKHLWILSHFLFLIVFYGFVQSKLASTLMSHDLWVKIPVWILLIGSVLRAMRRRKISILFSGIIIWGVILAWMYGFLPVSLIEVEHIKQVAKIILWLTVIFWFPLQFLNVINNYQVSQVIVLAVAWSAVLSLFSYGITKGLLVSALLLIVPINKLLNAPKAEKRNLVGTLDKRFYVPTALSLLFVALFVTHEGIWLIGSLIWVMFSITASHSFRYFRRTYDLIEDLYPNPQGKRRRQLLLFISMSITTILLFPGFLGELSREFVINLYNQASGLAFGLITILLAVQAIIPGVTTWASNSRKANYLREMRSILRANAGLEGFMQWFFVLFIYSLVAWLVSTRFLSNIEPLVDLSKDGAFNQPIYLLQEIGNLFSGQEVSLTRISTLIFGVFLYVAIYGIAQLYYLFIAANTLTLPIRDTLLSNPVEIEMMDLEGLENDEERERRTNAIKNKLHSSVDLNGQIINQLSVGFELNGVNQIGKVKAEFEFDFIELDELLDLIKKIFSSMFDLNEVVSVEISIARRTYQKFRKQPVFSLEINKIEWDFLKKEIPGFPFDYKLKCLGARLSDYVMAESQIA